MQCNHFTIEQVQHLVEGRQRFLMNHGIEFLKWAWSLMEPDKFFFWFHLDGILATLKRVEGKRWNAELTCGMVY